jgi:hypothetical protein
VHRFPPELGQDDIRATARGIIVLVQRDGDSEWYEVASRIAILLMILLVVVIVVWGLFGALDRPADSSTARYFPRAEPGIVQLRIDDRRYLARDEDGNGDIDCFVPVGAASVTGLGVYHAPDADCARFGTGTRVLDAELRAALTELARAKVEQKATFTTVLGDADGNADCVVSVFDGTTVLLRAEGVSCPGDGGVTFSDEQRVAFGEILALEEHVRARIRADS